MGYFWSEAIKWKKHEYADKSLKKLSLRSKLKAPANERSWLKKKTEYWTAMNKKETLENVTALKTIIEYGGMWYKEFYRTQWNVHEGNFLLYDFASVSIATFQKRKKKPIKQIWTKKLLMKSKCNRKAADFNWIPSNIINYTFTHMNAMRHCEIEIIHTAHKYLHPTTTQINILLLYQLDDAFMCVNVAGWTFTLD